MTRFVISMLLKIIVQIFVIINYLIKKIKGLKIFKVIIDDYFLFHTISMIYPYF